MTERGKFLEAAKRVLEAVPKHNPPWSLERQQNPYIMLKEPWSNIEVPIDEMLAPLVLHME